MKKNIKHTPFGYGKNTEICIADEQGVLYRRDGRVLISCPNKDLIHYAIKEGTIVIDKEAFAGCECLEEIIIPDGVTHIGDYAFEWCDFLQSVTIPDSVIYIGKSAFSATFGPESIVLPPHLEYLGDFSLCAYDLRTITSLNPAPPICGQLFTYDYDDAQGFSHSYMHKNCVLRVPKGCKEAYASADEWREFENIEEIDN